MTNLRELAARTLLASFQGTALPGWTKRRLDDGLGGICLFGGNVSDGAGTRALTASIHAAAPHAITCTDEEGGDVTRLHYLVGSPHAGHAVLGAVDDVELTRRVAGDIGRELLDVGVDLDLGPVADVNSNPLNPVIGVRSFGTDPNLVARHTGSWVLGVQAAGAGACLKHFPGHGDTTADSHVALPVAAAPVSVLRGRELVPFRAGVAAGAVAVMTSHVLVRALDRAQAATFSAATTSLLRESVTEGGLGFDGLLVSDALEMRGASGEIGVPAAAVRALAAGVDLLCLGAQVDDDLVQAVLDAVVGAVHSGALRGARLMEAAGRVDAARARLAGLRAVHHRFDDRSASIEAARRGITVSGPLASVAGAQVLRLVIEANQAVGRAPWGLPADGRVLAGRPATDVYEGDPWPDLDPARPVVAVVRDGHRYAWVRSALVRLAKRRPDLVVVELGWPGPDRLPGEVVVVTHGASAVSTRAVDELLGPGPR